jgi:putative OmpL-like beta-barrel porin-2
MLLFGMILVIALPATAFLCWCFACVRRDLRRKRKRCSSLLCITPPPVTSVTELEKATVIGIDEVQRRRKMRNTGKLAILLATAAFISTGARAQSQTNPSQETELQQLRELVLKLQARVDELEKKQSGAAAVSAGTQSAATSETPATGSAPATVTKEDRAVLDFFRGTTINGALDGYYGYNFNQPIGRVNLLRAYDVSSNSFSLNQANLIVEHAPNLDAGSRFGVRLDFQYGQATETLQGSAANELRPQVYRPVWQAYGTYVFPVGSGLTVDFGKWASSLGVESNYSKDQINYSRSLYFDFLPFYHMGFRASYNFSPKVNFIYMLTNGAQQAEDFNGFKSQHFSLVLKPATTVTWTANYYVGQEQRDVVAVLNPGLPAGPTQPGLPVTNISPAPNGREHILDSYVTWNATSRLTLVGEGDYVVNRVFSSSAPQHVTGGAAYARYQLTPKFALAGRGEYMSDHGGLFSGVTQALKETTATAEYKFAEGFLARMEWRRDFSNQPFFLTDVPGKLKNEQNTATLGLIWWFGQKQGAW